MSSLDTLLKDSDEHYNNLLSSLNPRKPKKFEEVPFSRILDLISEKEQHQNELCPECGKNSFIFNDKTSEFVCSSCNVVVDISDSDEQHFSNQQRRIFDNKQEQDRAINTPTNKLIQELNIATYIDPNDPKFKGITSEKRALFFRLAKRDRRVQFHSSKSRNYGTAYLVLTKITSGLSLPHKVSALAWEIYKDFHSKNKIKGRSIEGCVSASAHLSTRISNLFRFPEEICCLCDDVTPRQMQDYAREIEKTTLPDMGLKRPLVRAPAVLQYCLGKIQLPVYETPCRAIFNSLIENGFNDSGKDPTGIASAIAYNWGKVIGNAQINTQLACSALFRVTEVTTRNRHKQLSENFGLGEIVQKVYEEFIRQKP